MAQTPNSSLTAYAAPSDVTNRFDPAIVCQYLIQNGVTPLPSSLSTNAVLLQALLDASGDIEAVCTVAGRYQPADLQALNGAGQAKLQRLTCGLALGYLWESRPDRQGDPPKFVQDAYEMLEALGNGTMVFGLLQAQDDGTIQNYVEQPADVYNRNGMVFQARKYFGRRSWQSPAPAGD